MPAALVLLAIIALVLYIFFGYLWRKSGDAPSLIAAMIIIVVVVLLWFLPLRF